MLKIRPFRQKSGNCGPASLKMVLSYYGVNKTERQLVRLTGCTRKLGVEAEQIVKATRKLGLKASIIDNASFADIKKYVKKKKIPVIVDWFSIDDGHYSVVVDITKDNIFIIDPELGYVRAMRLKKFFRVWFDFPGEYIKTKNDIIIRRLIIVEKT